MLEPDDLIIACKNLVSRAGASAFEIGYLSDEPPHRWYAHAQYRNARITVEDHPTAALAVLALTYRLLRGALCRCGNPVALSDDHSGCRWQLVGSRWEPGCDAPPIKMAPGLRGDHAAMRMAVALRQVAENRAERRAARRGMRGV